MKKILFLLVIFFFGSSFAQSPEILGEMFKGKPFEWNPSYYSVSDNLSRIVFSEYGTFNFGDLDVKNSKINNLLVQTQNVLGIGFLDAAIKEGMIWQYKKNYSKFMLSGGSPFNYPDIISGLQVASALEYALNNGNNFGDVLRYFIAQGAISNSLENIGYWIYTDSSIPGWDWRTGKTFGWRGGDVYPLDPNGHNDVFWMSAAIPGYVSHFVYGDPWGTVRASAVFLSLGAAYVFSYFVTPENSGKVKQNKFTNFDFVFYLEGYDENKITGLGFGSKLGLKYKVPFEFYGMKPAVSFFRSPTLDARMQFSLKNKISFFGVTFGMTNSGAMKLYGIDVDVFKFRSWYGVFSFERGGLLVAPENKMFVLSAGYNFK